MRGKEILRLLIVSGLVAAGCGEVTTQRVLAPQTEPPPTHTPLPPQFSASLMPTLSPHPTATPEIKPPLPITIATPPATPEGEMLLPDFKSPRRGPGQPPPAERITRFSKGTLLVKTEDDDYIALLPDGGILPADAATFGRYRRPEYLSPDGRYKVKVATNQEGGNIRSEIRVVWRGSTTEGVAGYATGGRKRFLDGVLAISRVLPNDAYVVAVAQDISGGPLELIVVEVPYRSHHQGLIARLPDWIQGVTAINFRGEEVVFIGIVNGKKQLFRLSEPVYHQLPPERKINCPPPRHTLSDCLRKLNEEIMKRRILELIALPSGNPVEFAVVE